MKKVARSFAVFIFVIAVSVFPFNTASAQLGWYVGLFGGYTFSPDASLQYSDYTYNYNYDYKYDVNVQETWVFGVKFGITPPVLKYFSFEFEYSHLNPDIDRTALPRGGTVEGDVKFNNFMFNAIAKYPQGKIHPYIGAGLGFSSFDLSLSTTSPARSMSNDDTVFAWQILFGVEIDLTNNLSMDIGYRYFAAEANEDDHHDYYYEYYGTQIDYQTSMVTLGLKYRF
ncbi:MAG: outer membrane beta-barrel protein [Deltaproteobacteria bacterium]|nr:outer membrane beta-barrel protein [Deltaproteobacteria bacterium]